jgi:hypothetical protein
MHETCFIYGPSYNNHLLFQIIKKHILIMNLHLFQLFESHNITLRYLMKAVQSFERATQGFSSNIEEARKLQDPLALRILNDQLMQVERMFLLVSHSLSKNEILCSNIAMTLGYLGWGATRPTRRAKCNICSRVF